MGAYFRSGSLAIEPGLLEKSVTGLALPFTPTSVSVSLRLPNSDADVITAFLIGAPTSDGFVVGFSAETGDGYVLDWTASNTSASSYTADAKSNAVTYTDLFNAVSRFLGYGDTLTTRQTTEVDEIVQAGVRQFYYPPASEGYDGVYRWSFLRFGGSISLSAGVSRYHLPDGFGDIDGVLTYQAEERLPCVNRVAEELVRSRIAHRPENAPPRFCAIVYRSDFGERGQGKDIVFWPVPDRAYTLDYVADADTGKLDKDERLFPLGGQMFSELVLESCLSKAEQFSNDEMGHHTQLFNQHLVSAIARDRQNSATVYGDMSGGSQDPGIDGIYARRNLVHGLRITYNGQEL